MVFDRVTRSSGRRATAPAGAGEVTVVLTSCGRPDLLQETLESFFSHNGAPIAKFILVEDGADVLDAARSFPFPCASELACTGERVGQIAAIDYAYSRVETEYVFHLEDDWQFYAGGFIEKSIALLRHQPKCLQVYIRALDDTNGHPVHWRPRFGGGVLWRRMRFGFEAYGGVWNGFSFNPGLRRMADYVAVGGYGVHALGAAALHAGTEIVLSRLYRERGMFAAILADRWGRGYMRHIGWDRTVPEPAL